MSIARQTGFPPSTQITLQAYDSRGNVLSIQAEADFNGDGTIDYTSVVTVVYDGVKH